MWILPVVSTIFSLQYTCACQTSWLDPSLLLKPIKFNVFSFVTARKRSLAQGNIFRSVCQEFCPQGGSASVHAGILPPRHPEQTPGSRHPPNQAPPRPGNPPEQTPPEQTPPWDQAPPRRYGQRAGGTHPTGMQSCFLYCFTTLSGNVIITLSFF